MEFVGILYWKLTLKLVGQVLCWFIMLKCNVLHPSIHPSIHGSTVLLLDLGRFISFLILHIVGRTPWPSDQPVARPLPTHRTTQTRNKRTQTSMPLVGFEPTIPVFERAKIVHALDLAATVIGALLYSKLKWKKIISFL
jgi:hypothetical protein